MSKSPTLLPRLCGQLAIQDLWHDRNVSVCIVMALVAVMAPLLLLFGLKHGVVSQLQHDLAQKPNLLEIKTQGNTHRLDQQWLKTLAARPDVKFSIGLTRSLNTEAQISRTLDKDRILSYPDYIEIIPSAADDPIIRDTRSDLDDNHAIITRNIAENLGINVQDTVLIRLIRTKNGIRERSQLPLTIVHIIEPHQYSKAAAFVSMGVLLGLEFFIDGTQDHFAPINPIPASYAFGNVRVYAQKVEDVIVLSQWLEQQHIRTHSQQNSIHNVLAINAVLSLVFAVIALTALIGGILSLGGSFLANIDRKRMDIAILRLLGFNNTAIILYMAVQVMAITLCAYILSLALYFMGSAVFNHALGSHASIAAFSTYLSLSHLLLALGAALTISLIVACIGAIHAMRIEPAESLREI